ncbi:MAG: hypothetical protein QGG36_24545, partial [Pirellulaceae bacterium]|nr:hypothetical protein [Pirellulaceae bacterium]
LTEGRVEKVYEVDLCEVGPDQFVVNFRFGRAGSALRDGTRTVASVTREQAVRIYDELVSAKIAAGYRVAGEQPVASPPAGLIDPDLTPNAPPAPRREPARPEPEPLSPRDAAVMTRISDGLRSSSRWPLTRAVWRAGELELAAAESAIAALIGQGGEMLDYCAAAALSRCGSMASIDHLRAIHGNESRSVHVRRMALEAMRNVADDGLRSQLMGRAIDSLPESIQPLIHQGELDELRREIENQRGAGAASWWQLIERLYFVNNDRLQPILLEILGREPFQVHGFLRIRRIFKWAEVRWDAATFGVIARRFEVTPGNFRMPSEWTFRWRKVSKPTIGPEATAAYSTQTRDYFRKRIWRTLRRLGELESRHYLSMAVGALLPFVDDDGGEPTTGVCWDYSTYQSREVHYDRFHRYWAFNQLLYRNSNRYRPVADGKSFCCVGGYSPGASAPTGREEAFANLWDREPGAVMPLVAGSRCESVHAFAAKVLRAHPDFLRSLETPGLRVLLEAPYNVTVDLGVDAAAVAYDPSQPDPDLVLLLAQCVVERGRKMACTWIDQNRQFFFADSSFAFGVVSAPHADIRLYARDVLKAVTIGPEVSQALIGRLIGFLTDAAADQAEIAADVALTLHSVYRRELAQVGVEIIGDLMSSSIPAVRRFAGDLIAAHQTLAAEPPMELVKALLADDEAIVREAAVRIVAGLPASVLKNSIELLIELSRHPQADIRAEIRPTVRELAQSDAAFGKRIAAALVDAILIPGAAEGVPSHTARVLREDLLDHLGEIGAETIWRLLRSRSQPAQEVGGALLGANLPPSSLQVEQLVDLASHDVRSVREASWRMFADDLDRMRTALATSMRVLDARWEDSRQYFFTFFREKFRDDELTPEILVAICDSPKPDVQQFGRELITRRFRAVDGPEYLLKLSEHPTSSLQLFATNYLEAYAVDNLERFRSLSPFFVSVLSRVNRGRVAKQRVFAFIAQEATRNAEFARVAVDVLGRVSATCAIGDKALAIETLTAIRDQHPEIESPVRLAVLESR